jgi:hypothetical protein
MNLTYVLYCTLPVFYFQYGSFFCRASRQTTEGKKIQLTCVRMFLRRSSMCSRMNKSSMMVSRFCFKIFSNSLMSLFLSKKRRFGFRKRSLFSRQIAILAEKRGCDNKPNVNTPNNKKLMRTLPTFRNKRSSRLTKCANNN